jgi:transposase-like protein
MLLFSGFGVCLAQGSQLGATMIAVDLGKLSELLGKLTPSRRAALRSGDRAVKLLAQIDAHFGKAPVCRHCNARDVQKWGRASALRRYRCRACGKTFNALTGTPLARLRRRDAWAAFAAGLAEGLSIRKAAMRCDIHASTSLRWLRRFPLQPVDGPRAQSRERRDPTHKAKVEKIA